MSIQASSPSLVWKLLRQHVSIPQLAGFFLANLIGMTILLLGYQLYRDVMPVYTAEDSFMKSNSMVVSKKIGTAQVISQRTNFFTPSEIEELSSQPFAENVGVFTSAEYKMEASMSIGGRKILNIDLPIESIPDAFIDMASDEWKFDESRDFVPLILPRSYVTMYNFGFAQQRSLPQMSEQLLSLIEFDLSVRGNGLRQTFKGRVVGLSNRFNSILVPWQFMAWSNRRFAPDGQSAPTRLLLTPTESGGEAVSQFMEDHGYELENDRQNTEKAIYFVRLVTTMIVGVGLLISLLSFFILVLSIYLLVQKNTMKLQNLLLIGYAPAQVARPYQMLAVGLTFSVFILSILSVAIIRHAYLPSVELIAPAGHSGNLWPSVLLGFAVFMVLSGVDMYIIWKQVVHLWADKEKV